MDEQALADSLFHDEARVPKYALPSPLADDEGRETANGVQWMSTRRPRLLRLFRDEMYGPLPPRPDTMRFETLSRRDDALGGTAIRKEIRIHCAMADGRAHALDLLLYAPRTGGPAPVCLGLNFQGNHACTEEEDVAPAAAPLWDGRPGADGAWTPLPPAPRGRSRDRWCFADVVRRGYASATLHRDQVFPDMPLGYAESVYRLFHPPEELARPDRPYGAISAWAWGLMRGLDALEGEALVDATRCVLHGHSRLGKTALWAGANDTRFRVVVSNNSGCGGAALTRRGFGESLAYLLHYKPYWFTPAFRRYIGREEELPFDQHALIALVAPRPAYVASATDDHHADPRGEFLAARGADAVYRLFGSPGLGVERWPPPDTPVGTDIGYHLRTGGHGITRYDWDRFLDFADRHGLRAP